MRAWMCVGLVAAVGVSVAGCDHSISPDEWVEELGAATFSNGEELARHGDATARAAWKELFNFEIEKWPDDGDACPRLTSEDDTIAMEGGCTDSKGKVWSGRATRTGSLASRSFRGAFEGVEVASTHTCDDGSVASVIYLMNGTGSATDHGDGFVTFEVDVRWDKIVVDPGSCDEEEFTAMKRFSGAFQESGPDADGDGTLDHVVWDGRGSLADSTDGVLDVEASNVVYDDALCGSEAASGRTVLRSAGHRAVVRYDGADDCDSPQTVTWMYDGKDMGETELPACAIHSVADLGASAALVPAALLGLVGLVRLRLRR